MSQISSPFCASRSFPVKEFIEKEFIHYMEVESINEDYNPEKRSEFLIEKSIEEYERIPIDEFINSFASKVGLKNELNGIVSKTQMDAYIQDHKAQPGFVDLTKLPDTEFGFSEYAARIEEIWKEIPEELKQGMTKEEFLKSVSAQKIADYVKTQIPNEENKTPEEDK